MKLQKSQLRLIILLNALLLVLVAAIAAECIIGGRDLFSPPVGAQTPADGSTDETPGLPSAPEYSTVRKPRLSLSDALELETNLGGSRNESLTAAYAHNGLIYVFGGTESDDYDMSGLSRAFMAVLDEELCTVRFSSLGNGEKLEAVIPGEGGFLTVFSSEEKITLRLYGFDGALLSAAAADSASAAKFGGIKLFDGKYALITELAKSPLEKTKLFLQVFDYSLHITYERIVNSPYSLSYLDCFETAGAFTLFFNSSSDLSSQAGVAVCSDADQPEIAYIDKGGNYRASAAAPYADGWALSVLYQNGEGGIMLSDGDFKKQAVMFHGPAPSSSATLYYADGLYYAGFYGESTQETTAYNADFTSKRTLAKFDGLKSVTDCLSGRGYALFAGHDGNAITVIGSAETCYLKLGSQNESGARLIKSGNNIYVLAESSQASTDVGGNFGGTDIWLARLKI